MAVIIFVSMILLGLGCRMGAGAVDPTLQRLYNGVLAQEKILKVGNHINGQSILPFEAALNCASCGSNIVNCIANCQAFYKLMHSMAEIHSQYQKLQALQEQNTDDQVLEALGIILKKLTEQACTVLTSKLPTGSFNCTYTELMKIKVKLELLFATQEANDIINMEVDRMEKRIQNNPESWINDLSCNITDNSITAVIRTAFDQAACHSS